MLRDEDAWFKSFQTMLDYSEKNYWYLAYLKPFSKSLVRFINWEEAMFSATFVSYLKINFQSIFKFDLLFSIANILIIFSYIV